MTWTNWIVTHQIEITTITSWISALWAILIPILLLIFWHKLTQKIKRRDNLFEIRKVLYPELYEKLQIAISALLWIYGFTYSKTYQDCSKQDIKKECEKFELNNFQTQEILDLWDKNIREAIEKLQEYDQMIKMGKAFDIYNEFHNFFVLKKLFFSQFIIESLKKVKDPLDTLKSNYQAARDLKYMYKTGNEEISKIMKENMELRKTIKKETEDFEKDVRNELLQ